ncbi:MAG: hypothetical protein ACREU6_16380 [Steroidobacteraceae bacterium]
MALRFPRRGGAHGEPTVLGTYTFPNRTVQILQTRDERIRWTCDCEKFRGQTAHREPLWCKHIAKAAARRSIERLTRRAAVQRPRAGIKVVTSESKSLPAN